MTHQIRPALPEDCFVLTRMVRTSNAYNGEYRVLVQDIAIFPRYVQDEIVYVYETEEAIVGFYSLTRKGEHIELDFMFVGNAHAGQGIGRLLFEHMVGVARELGASGVEIVAHPPAEAFYQKMGAVTVGMSPPHGKATWARPKMWLALNTSRGSDS